jgi:uncharacterized integral membrane protein
VRYIYWFVWALLALVLVIFAVSNRVGATVTFWPLPVTLEAPLYLVVLLTLLVGFLVGELVAWINGGRARRLARERARRIDALERELAAVQKERDAALAAASPAAVPVPIGQRLP